MGCRPSILDRWPQSFPTNVEATPARTFDEVAATSAMIERTRRRFNLKA
jgi:hypothetical protein